MRSNLSRRRFNQLIGTGLLASASSSLMVGSARAGDTITVLNWQGYGTDEAWALKAFTEKTGITVKHDYYNSEPEMITKLRTNPGAYDVALINSARTSQVQAENLLDPIPMDKLSNAADLTPGLRDSHNLFWDGKHYGASWLWGINSLAIRRGKVPTPDSLSILADPAYVGRVALLDDVATGIGVGALMTGQDINNPADLKAVGDKLKSLKKNIKLLWSSEDEWNKAFSADAFDVSIYWSGSCIRSQRTFKLPVDFVIPKEGAIAWLDGLSLPASSTHKDAALTFINYMIDPSFYVPWSTNVGAPASANGVAMSKLPNPDPIHKPELLSKLQFMSPLPDDRRTAFSDLWEEVKASYAKG